MPANGLSPDETLLRFVERLPTTIKDVVLARCCVAFGRLQPVAKQDLFATFRAILFAPAGHARAYMCAQMSAVVELALNSPDAGIPEAWHETSASQRLANIDLQAPLTQKHWIAAREEFLALRAGELHVESLSAMLMQALDAQQAVLQRPQR